MPRRNHKRQQEAQAHKAQQDSEKGLGDMGYIYSPFLYDGEPQQREELAMTDTDKIDKILDRVREKRGIKTRAQTERENAVRVLAGKQPVKKELRPEVNQLLGRGE